MKTIKAIKLEDRDFVITDSTRVLRFGPSRRMNHAHVVIYRGQVVKNRFGPIDLQLIQSIKPSRGAASTKNNNTKGTQ